MSLPVTDVNAPRFRTAVDLGLILLVCLPLLALPILLGPDLLVLIVCACLTGIILLLICPCYYQLQPEHLLIRCGFVFECRIPYQQINDVLPSYNPESAPALSFDRLALCYGQQQQILISPADRVGFLTELAKRRSGSNKAL